VWIGNDDNAPMKGVTGGSTPARIWKDFMRGALKIEAAPQPQATESPDPEGPVQQLDVEGGEIVVGEDGTTLRIGNDGVVIAQDGVPVEILMDENGVVIEPVPFPPPGSPP
jgi:penicillin-binding protein 1A